MNRPRLEVPRELTDLLLGLTVNVLLEKPADLVEYAVNYFTKLKQEKGGQEKNNCEENESKTACEDEAVRDSEDEEFEPPPPRKAQNQYSRRKSVFAEQYDPEEDDDDDVERLIFPKTDEQRKSLAESVKNILLFRSLDIVQIQEVIDAMMEKKVLPEETVIKQGDDGDFFYIIQKGIFNIFVDTDEGKKCVGKYSGEGSFGELALMYNMPRAATIEAVTEGLLWAMDRQTFRRIVLKSAFKKRKEYEKLLEGVPMLQTLDLYERMNLCDALVPKAFSDGELIIQQSAIADGMYFIEAGECRITMSKEVDGKKEEILVTTLSKGQYFGELALVTKKNRAANVYAVGHVKLAFLDVAAFERLLGSCRAIMSRNVDHYQKQVVELFGSEANISDLR